MRWGSPPWKSALPTGVRGSWADCTMAALLVLGVSRAMLCRMSAQRRSLSVDIPSRCWLVSRQKAGASGSSGSMRLSWASSPRLWTG